MQHAQAALIASSYRQTSGSPGVGRAPDAVRVAEGDQAHALDQADAGVGPLQHAHQGPPGLQHQALHIPVRVAVGLQGAALVRAVDLIRKHVQQHLRSRTAAASAGSWSRLPQPAGQACGCSSAECSLRLQKIQLGRALSVMHAQQCCRPVMLCAQGQTWQYSRRSEAAKLGSYEMLHALVVLDSSRRGRHPGVPRSALTLQFCVLVWWSDKDWLPCRLRVGLPILAIST